MQRSGERLGEAIERAMDARTIIEDEKGNKRVKGDLTCWARLRIFLNQWWVFIAIVIAASQVAQAVISILNYFKCRW